jgi:hypothetical protein
MKFRLYPGIWVAGAIIVLSLGFRQLWLNTCISSTEFEQSLAPDNVPVFIPSTIPDSTLNPTPTPSLTENATPENLFKPSSDPVSTGQEAAFRVSNQSNHPVRVAWRARSPTSEPIHWDFAPQEGSVNGLILSRPETDLTLQPGDVLIVFAQDGSRRYWGPYIVGETASPTWNSQVEEWQLVVQP